MITLLRVWAYLYVFSLSLICSGSVPIFELNANRTRRLSDSTSEFSGIYTPMQGDTVEHYAGACLIPKERLWKTQERIEHTAAGFLEGVGFALCGNDLRMEDRITVMTRDYFDFAVTHLSSTTNQLPIDTNEKLNRILLDQVKSMVDAIKFEATKNTTRAKIMSNTKDNGFSEKSNQMKAKFVAMFNQELKEDHLISSRGGDARLIKNTAALIPFALNPASADKGSMQIEIRRLYFLATFWSVYRHIPKIVVTVGTKKDHAMIQHFISKTALPVWKVIDLSDLFDPTVGADDPKTLLGLPRESILEVTRRTKNPGALNFHNIHYLYYTESDLILMSRPSVQTDMMDTLHDSGGTFALAPHRFQSMPIPANFHEAGVDHLWKTSTEKQHRAFYKTLNVDAVKDKIVAENILFPSGSCCDDGRFMFRDCKNWWYNCEEYGLKDSEKWLLLTNSEIKKSSSGNPLSSVKSFSIPTITEHKGKCKYSETRQLCPIPKSCKQRVPDEDGGVPVLKVETVKDSKGKQETQRIAGDGVNAPCNEMDIIDKRGF